MTYNETVLQKAVSYFSQNTLEIIDIAVLQPADLFLNIVGEDLRRLLFMTQNTNGEDLCLRPEFTIPVCRYYQQNSLGQQRTYSYAGEIFRQEATHNQRFYQAGIEEFGMQNKIEADARSLYHSYRLIEFLAPDKKIAIKIGDHGLFSALLNAVGLPQNWQKKIMRYFGHDEKLHLLLTNFSKNLPIPCQRSDIHSFTQNNDTKSLTNLIEQEMLLADISPSSGREPWEIAQRLIEQQIFTNYQLKHSTLSLLVEFLSIKAPLTQADTLLRNFISYHGLDQDPDLVQSMSDFSARIEKIAHYGLDLSSFSYSASFGQRLRYYTGFVYEITERDRSVLASGGRYDRLLTFLGVKDFIPAIGFSLWLNQL